MYLDENTRHCPKDTVQNFVQMEIEFSYKFFSYIWILFST